MNLKVLKLTASLDTFKDAILLREVLPLNTHNYEPININLEKKEQQIIKKFTDLENNYDFILVEHIYYNLTRVRK